MNAQLRPVSSELEEGEFHLTFNRSDRGSDEYLTGIIRGADVALFRARAMAATGWRVTLEPVDRFGVDQVRHILEPIR